MVTHDTAIPCPVHPRAHAARPTLINQLAPQCSNCCMANLFPALLPSLAPRLYWDRCLSPANCEEWCCVLTVEHVRVFPQTGRAEQVPRHIQINQILQRSWYGWIFRAVLSPAQQFGHLSLSSGTTPVEGSLLSTKSPSLIGTHPRLLTQPVPIHCLPTLGDHWLTPLSVQRD